METAHLHANSLMIFNLMPLSCRIQTELSSFSSQWGQHVDTHLQCWPRKLPFIYHIQCSDCPRNQNSVYRDTVPSLVLAYVNSCPSLDSHFLHHVTEDNLMLTRSPAEGANRSAAQASAGLSWGEISTLGWQHNGKMSLFPHLSCGDRQNFRLPWRELPKQGHN